MTESERVSNPKLKLIEFIIRYRVQLALVFPSFDIDHRIYVFNHPNFIHALFIDLIFMTNN